MRASIKVEGLDELLAGLKGLDDAAKNRISRNAARAGANAVKKALKQAAPVSEEQSKDSKRVGRLKSNIKSRQVKRLPYYVVSTGKAFWGGFTDQGTKHISPTYWWTNTVEKIRGPVTAGMVENIGRSIQREADKIK